MIVRTHVLFLLSSLFLFSSIAPQFVLVLSHDDLKDAATSSAAGDESSSDWDDFGDTESDLEEEELDDRGPWRPIFEPDLASSANPSKSDDEVLYYSGITKMLNAVSSGDPATMEDGASDIEASAAAGYSHAQSALGFLYSLGMMRERNKSKALIYHSLAAEGGNLQSKMALAYTYSRQDMHDRAVELYAELQGKAVDGFLFSKGSPGIELVRIHYGGEENKEALLKFRGQEDEDFQILEYQAQKGNAVAMYKIGIFYYFGLRGLRRDHDKALSWFLKAVEKGEPRSMELLGEIYARGVGVERNYTKALEWLNLASEQQLYSAYSGMGYLYVNGYGVEKKNYTRAKEYFEKAAENEEAGGYYNLGVMYLKGIAVKRDVQAACKFFILAANAGQSKAFYQLAKMFHNGVGLKKNLLTATGLYKLVAERGPWQSLSRWAVESYLKGDVGRALFLYLRMAELGYEVAQSNAAWILDKYGERSMCIGESGLCTESERRFRAHSLWWLASKQGNEDAALQIGDAYNHTEGSERDYDAAASAFTMISL